MIDFPGPISKKPARGSLSLLKIRMTLPVATDPISNSEFLALALERYEAPLVGYATHILGDVEHARDVVQDTFLKLCREGPGKVRDHLAQWLFTVCRNREEKGTVTFSGSVRSECCPLQSPDNQRRRGQSPSLLCHLLCWSGYTSTPSRPGRSECDSRITMCTSRPRAVRRRRSRSMEYSRKLPRSRRDTSG